jgi:hypothetical protein
MPNIVVALLLACGVGGWTYAKIVRRTGGNAKSDVTVVIVVSILAFFVMLSFMSMVNHK